MINSDHIQSAFNTTCFYNQGVGSSRGSEMSELLFLHFCFIFLGLPQKIPLKTLQVFNPHLMTTRMICWLQCLPTRKAPTKVGTEILIYRQFRKPTFSYPSPQECFLVIPQIQVQQRSAINENEIMDGKVLWARRG